MAVFVRRRWPAVVAAVAVLALLGGLGTWLVTRDPSGRAAPNLSPADPLDASAYDIEVTPGETPPETTPTAIDIAALLTASDAELKTYADQRVAATSVRVLRRVGPSAAWIGTSETSRVLLFLVATEHPFTFAPGAELTFTGTGMLASPGFGRQIGLTGEELADFERQGTYVEVTEYVEG